LPSLLNSLRKSRRFVMRPPSPLSPIAAPVLVVPPHIVRAGAILFEDRAFRARVTIRDSFCPHRHVSGCSSDGPSPCPLAVYWCMSAGSPRLIVTDQPVSELPRATRRDEHRRSGSSAHQWYPAGVVSTRTLSTKQGPGFKMLTYDDCGRLFHFLGVPFRQRAGQRNGHCQRKLDRGIFAFLLWLESLLGGCASLVRIERETFQDLMNRTLFHPVRTASKQTVAWGVGSAESIWGFPILGAVTSSRSCSRSASSSGSTCAWWFVSMTGVPVSRGTGGS